MVFAVFLLVVDFKQFFEDFASFPKFDLADLLILII